jgi:hypothetical protein
MCLETKNIGDDAIAEAIRYEHRVVALTYPGTFPPYVFIYTWNRHALRRAFVE